MLSKDSDKSNYIPKGKINVKPYLDKEDGGTLDSSYTQESNIPFILAISAVVSVLVLWKIIDLISNIYKPITQNHDKHQKSSLEEEHQTSNQEDILLENNQPQAKKIAKLELKEGNPSLASKKAENDSNINIFKTILNISLFSRKKSGLTDSNQSDLKDSSLERKANVSEGDR